MFNLKFDCAHMFKVSFLGLKNGSYLFHTASWKPKHTDVWHKVREEESGALVTEDTGVQY